jgi:ribonuclease P protein component
MDGGHGHNLGFGRAMRIKHNRDFARTRSDGQRLGGASLLANWRTLPSGSTSRLGIVTSAKIGPAVKRNSVRRLFREIFRKHQHDLLQPVDLVLVARNSSVNKDYHSLEKDFLTTLRKAGLLGKPN